MTAREPGMLNRGTLLPVAWWLLVSLGLWLLIIALIVRACRP